VPGDDLGELSEAEPHQRLFKGRLSETIRSSDKSKTLEDLKTSLSGVPLQEICSLSITGSVASRMTTNATSVSTAAGNMSAADGVHRRRGSGPPCTRSALTAEMHRSTRASSEKTFIRWSGSQDDQAGNYQLFENLSGDATATARLGDWSRSHHSWFICGLQIVEEK